MVEIVEKVSGNRQEWLELPFLSEDKTSFLFIIAYFLTLNVMLLMLQPNIPYSSIYIPNSSNIFARQSKGNQHSFFAIYLTLLYFGINIFNLELYPIIVITLCQ